MTDPRDPAGTPEPTTQMPAAPDPGAPPWMWAVIAVLVVLVIILLAVVLTGDDDDVALETPTPRPTVTLTTPTPTPTATPAPTPTPTAAPPTATATPPAVSGPTATTAPATTPPASPTPTAPPTRGPDDAGIVVAADGRQLFPVDEAQLASFVGQELIGDDVLIQSVVDGAGFWIGSGEDNRVFVEHDPGLLPLGFAPREGERFDFEGTMVANDDDTLVPDEAGGEQYRRQGVHIELSEAEAA